MNWHSGSLICWVKKLQFCHLWSNTHVTQYHYGHCFMLQYPSANVIPLITHLFEDQFRLHFNSKQAFLSAPIQPNPMFSPSLIDFAFQIWRRNGVKCVKDLFKDGMLISFQPLKQILRAISTSFMCIYRSVVLQIEISSSVCIRHGLLQFKVLHRLHLFKSKLAKMFSGLDSTCPRWGLEPADLSHMFWGWPRLTKLWSDIFRKFSFFMQQWNKFYGTNLDPNPLSSIFVVVPEEMQLTTNQTELIIKRAT